MSKTTTTFTYNHMENNKTIYNEPLYYLAELLQYLLIKDDLLDADLTKEDKEKYKIFEKLQIKDLHDKNFKSEENKELHFEIDSYFNARRYMNEQKENSDNALETNTYKINYLLNSLKYLNGEFVFEFDKSEFILKTDKVFDKKAISINRGEDFAIFRTYTITYNSTDFAKFEKFIDNSIKYFIKYYNNCKLGSQRIKLFLSEDGGYFTSIGSRNKRSLDTIYLPKKQKTAIIDDMTNFLTEKTIEKYNKLGITHKRIYLFEGIPGSGKSSFIMALASQFNYNIAIISFTPKMTDNDLIRMLRNLGEKGEKLFVIFEDIDCIFKERKSNDESRNLITFSGLLNTLDGMSSYESIYFMTTNHIEHLDSALIRPGRVDYIMKFTNVVKEQVLDIFSKFTSSTEDANKFYEKLSDININVCISLLQQYLLKYIDNPQDAIKNIREIKTMYDSSHIQKEAGETGLYN